MNLLYNPSFKYSAGELRKNHQEFMDSNVYHPHHQQHQQQELQQHQHHQHNSGLMRYRSAPSSFLASLVDGSNGVDSVGREDCLRSSSPEVETMLTRFMSSCNDSGDSGSQMGYQAQQVHVLPDHNPVAAGTALDSSFGVTNYGAVENSMKDKMGAGNRSILMRQSSSPAGLFSDLTMNNGFTVMRNVGSFRACNGELSPSASMTKLNDALSFSAVPSSCSMHMPQIADFGNEIDSQEDQSLANDNDSNQQYVRSCTTDSWNGPSFNRHKKNQRIHGLTHHLSLPKTSIEMAAIENILHLQGSVPCKIRAKRGCATHPRSIAERVRRTRISERMRKLQELFPNMDKQTNTADMLELAVEYIKDLQKQVKTLTDTKARCTCSRKQKHYSNHSA
ncbi:hypothetical protein CJ030_MR1G017701 [Morella rubra]|uniref:BHLH domain-containing protein n=1 Tax=Morella rubra TaxID=262757 RepID=A0A6A1WJS2_9ROSI|nr:hypothetical protein CJ030_MR1G017701 [Morella rubra]